MPGCAGCPRTPSSPFEGIAMRALTFALVALFALACGSGDRVLTLSSDAGSGGVPGSGAGPVRQVTASVQLAGAGQGRVTSEPPGIDCAGPPANCSAAFPAGTRLVLRSRAKLLSTARGFDIAACTERSCDAAADLS